MTRTVADVMTSTVVTVGASAPFKEVVRLMHEYRVSALPVVDEDGLPLGVVSEGDLILKEDRELEGEARWLEGRNRRMDRTKAAGLLASELMSWPAITIAPEASLGEAARLMHRRAIKRLPVVASDGTVLGIVSRTDLLKVFLRDDRAIAQEIREEVIRRTLWIDPDTIRVVVHDGVVTLAGQIERRSLVAVLERLVSSTEGVVGIQDEKLSHLIDDTSTLGDISLPWSSMAPKARR